MPPIVQLLEMLLRFHASMASRFLMELPLESIKLFGTGHTTVIRINDPLERNTLAASMLRSWQLPTMLQPHNQHLNRHLNRHLNQPQSPHLKHRHRTLVHPPRTQSHLFQMPPPLFRVPELRPSAIQSWPIARHSVEKNQPPFANAIPYLELRNCNAEKRHHLPRSSSWESSQ